jgi:phage-related protein
VTPKPLTWLGNSRKSVRAFPALARSAVGHELFLVQQGLPPSDWKPMHSVGPGVSEIRIHADQEYRVLYVARFEEAIYVLHAFEKRTRKTRVHDLELARTRLTQLIRFTQGR